MPNIKPVVNKIAKSGIFRSPLTYPCPKCGIYHQSIKSVNKCKAILATKYDAMLQYWSDFVRELEFPTQPNPIDNPEEMR